MKSAFIILCLTAHCCVAQTDLKKGLRAWYSFAGNANDQSGNNNNPVFNNTQFTTDRLGQPNNAVHFNGQNSYIRIPNSPSLNMMHQISIFAWVRPTGFYYDICHASCILSKGGGNYQSGNYALRYDDALITEGMGCSGDPLTDSVHQNFRGTGTVLKPYTPYIQKNQWYAVLYTNDGQTAKLYVDCELKYAVDYYEYFTNNDDLFLGKLDDEHFPFWLHGDIDEVRIYDRELNAAEMDLLCDMKKKTPPPVPVTPVPVTVADSNKLSPVKAPKDLVIEKRTNELVKLISTDHDSVSVTLYDNGDIDGDSVTLIYNDQILATHLRLTDKPQTFYIRIRPGNERNELVMYAENLGSIPPNTALMVIYDGTKRYELNVSSTKKTNGSVSFRLRE
ncbi:MAG: LamG domain-containing protein [Ferruginibacter sp.]